MRAVSTAIRYGSFPLTFVAAMWWGQKSFAEGWHPGLILSLITGGVIALLVVFERLCPYAEKWQQSHDDFATDVLHSSISMVLLPKVLEALLMGLLLTLALSMKTQLGFALWPEQWPWVAQLALALLIPQFFEYWVHRWMHEIPLFWRLHAVHHSSERLYWLNAGRFHPLDTAISYTVGLAVLVLLNAPPKVVMLQTVWIAVHGLFQHCNVDVRLGPLNYIFSMAELHRWHHSQNLDEANTNYGNNIILWDLLFGTFYWPKDKKPDPNVGLSDLRGFPQTYGGQIMAPFRWRRIQEDSADAASESS